LTNTEFYTDIDFVADGIMGLKDSLFVNEPQMAMFYYFKPSGKWYAEGHGFIPMINSTWTREELLNVNGGLMPGLNSDGQYFRIVVIPDVEAVYGWPQILEPVK
jgi:hypothetical protein